jgi:hypothetical protein
MDSIKHRKILDCVIIIKDSDANKAVDVMKRCKATVHVFPVLAPFTL